MNLNEEKRKRRHMSLKRNRLAYVSTYLNNHALIYNFICPGCTYKAVQEAIQKSELNAGDAEAIKAFRCAVRIYAGAVLPVVSSDA